MTVREAAMILGVSVTTIRDMIERGTLKARAVPTDLNQHGIRWHIDARSVESEVKRQEMISLAQTAGTRKRGRGRPRGSSKVV